MWVVHTTRYEGRWVMVDPQGRMHIDAAVCHIVKGHGEVQTSAFASKYADDGKWFKDARAVMSGAGFNGAGAFSDIAPIQDWNRTNPRKPFTYCVNLALLKQYIAKELKAPRDYDIKKALPIFDGGFDEYARKSASGQMSSMMYDPALVGYFSDNELDFASVDIDEYLKQDEDTDGRKAADKWLEAKGLAPVQITDEVRREFVAYVADTYYAKMESLIRSIDQNHLYLGSRLHGDLKFSEEVVRAAGKYCDVVSFNYYSDWCVRPEEVAMWNEWSGKPFMITEFYTKAEDSGLANTRGAGWRVPTQADRADFYQNFVISLLQSGACVGWHWFKYQDNDPTDKTMDPTNTDANKGIVDNAYEPYGELLEAMKEVNLRRYTL